MGKAKKKSINVLTAFFISYKSDVKIFLKWIVNQCPKALISISHKNPFNINKIQTKENI